MSRLTTENAQKFDQIAILTNDCSRLKAQLQQSQTQAQALNEQLKAAIAQSAQKDVQLSQAASQQDQTQGALAVSKQEAQQK